MQFFQVKNFNKFILHIFTKINNVYGVIYKITNYLILFMFFVIGIFYIYNVEKFNNFQNKAAKIFSHNKIHILYNGTFTKDYLITSVKTLTIAEFTENIKKQVSFFSFKVKNNEIYIDISEKQESYIHFCNKSYFEVFSTTNKNNLIYLAKNINILQPTLNNNKITVKYKIKKIRFHIKKQKKYLVQAFCTQVNIDIASVYRKIEKHLKTNAKIIAIEQIHGDRWNVVIDYNPEVNLYVKNNTELLYYRLKKSGQILIKLHLNNITELDSNKKHLDDIILKYNDVNCVDLRNPKKFIYIGMKDKKLV